MVAIFVGTGIGGGLIDHGELEHGSHGGAGEIGHTVIRAGKGLCSCGQKGHLEALAARPAVTRYIATTRQARREDAARSVEVTAGPTSAS